MHQHDGRAVGIAFVVDRDANAIRAVDQTGHLLCCRHRTSAHRDLLLQPVAQTVARTADCTDVPAEVSATAAGATNSPRPGCVSLRAQ
ncbi:Uncharacterised protein [Mycobacterium tuberculosis]|nr:Uncharacterised protein [Mycobacterium tuberculosis]CKT31157.1 Uncharacterised protein [Mycobacterium tuberculosis]COW11381.1 Uncharacterised protein [Mycobacterium tuberculosis]COW49423.1 Uncharacterised protein [Mycobacterium tuberculosis]COX16479.1 Uncharacterised protein [Mycobacterium tuberculosis]